MPFYFKNIYKLPHLIQLLSITKIDCFAIHQVYYFVKSYFISISLLHRLPWLQPSYPQCFGVIE